LHEAARFLALVERDEIAALPHAGLPRASWRLVHSYLPSAPLAHPVRGEPDVPLLSWLYRTLGSGGLIGVVNGRLRLARAAHDWLALPTSAQVSALRQIWDRAPEVAYAWLPLSAPASARGDPWRELTRQVVTSVKALPADTWITSSDILADLTAQAQTLNFGVARNLPSVGQALAQQVDLLTAFLLTEILPRLGILALQGEGTDRCLAVTAEGGDWLRRGRGSGKPAASVTQPADTLAGSGAALPEPAGWHVTDDLRLTISPEAPAAATFEAMQFADFCSVGPPARYRITHDSFQRCVSRGADPADVLFLLAQGAGQSLPGPAVAQLTPWREELALIYCEPGFCLRPAVPGLMSALRDREPFRAATEPAASRRGAFVGQARAAALMRYLRRSGYVLCPDNQSQADSAAAPILTPLLRRRLPLVALATLAGVYSHLRTRVPGLADLGLADLERTLLEAMPPAERSAVARLVASDDALLAGSLCADPMAADEVAEPGPAQPAVSSALAPAPVPPAFPDLRARLDEAITRGAAIDLLYVDTQGAVTQRRVRPLRLEERWGRHYLVALCELRRDERSFRLDRIVEVTPA